MTQNRFPSRAEVLRRRRLLAKPAAGSLGVEQAKPEPVEEPKPDPDPDPKPVEEPMASPGNLKPVEEPERALISFPPKRPYWR